MNTIYIKKEDDFVDLNTILADIIGLAEPIKPLRSNCKGLCQKCGINKKNIPAHVKLKIIIQIGKH